MEKILQGLGTSMGRAKGKVRIVSGEEDHHTFRAGEILVTHITDPTMVPIMAKAAGIICEIGGMTSHPSIVSREMGIPCVVGLKTVTKWLKDGETVEVKATEGRVLKQQR